MMRRAHLTCVTLLLTAGLAVAQPRAGEWVNYRDAYRSMVVFEKYGKPKNFIQHHVQVVAKEKGVSADGLQLTLEGKGSKLNLPLDATGRAVFPLLKSAYDDNAALVLNRRAGQYVFRARVSIVVRPNGVYEVADLRVACEQALGYQSHVDGAYAAKKCVGVRFVFAQSGEPGVRIRKREGEPVLLAARPGAPFADDPNDAYKVVDVRFDEHAAQLQVLTPNAPLAIAALTE